MKLSEEGSQAGDADSIDEEAYLACNLKRSISEASGPRLASSKESMVLWGQGRSMNHTRFSCRKIAARIRVRDPLLL